MLPSHPAGRDLAEGHYHDLDYLEFLDRIGGEEAWIGSHYTIPTEPAPSVCRRACALTRWIG